jgi:putative transposase
MRPPRIPGFSYLGPCRYSLCFVANQRAELFTTHAIVGAALREIQRTCREDQFALLAYCFMPDHVHLVVEGLSDSSDLRRCVKVAKQRVAFVFRTQFAIPLTWQHGYYEHVLRSNQSTNTVVRYVLDNPVRAGFVGKPQDNPAERPIARELIGIRPISRWRT